MRFGEKSDLASRTKVLREEVQALGLCIASLSLEFFRLFSSFRTVTPFNAPFEFFIVVKNWVNPPHRLILF